MKLRRPLVRLYYNASDAYGKEWSIDFGENTPEICIGAVLIQDVSAGTGLNRAVGINKPAQPHGYLTFKEVELEVNLEGNSVIISCPKKS